ncbi:HAD-IA family hydrolase [Oculatella sp. LEGE 06141]|uniref:HAD-IA family hydrolase n=1 Tax=Oculatella sp. LEGE 06141 TaxID=1828648 RepID=UPI001881B570|nr:HAD-IA family hydrolase [Oculatella sp. LEGE 06141]MBE9182799.1 HAD-IA family hydrolase [Oculatella sp. LEGE 06141]
MVSLRRVTHLIYDLDGLLLDTEPIHATVNQTLAARFGKTFDFTIHAKIIGRTAEDSAQLIIDLLELPLTVSEYLTQRDAIIFDLYPSSCPMPGAVELTQHFYRYRVPQAIATSSAHIRFSSKTTHHQDWLQLFQCIVMGDDPAIQNGKPSPDIFWVTAERLGTRPDQCLVFEDSIAGVSAAKQAGMSVVAVPAPNMSRTLFQEADQILESLTEFEPEQWHLPALR